MYTKPITNYDKVQHLKAPRISFEHAKNRFCHWRSIKRRPKSRCLYRTDGSGSIRHFLAIQVPSTTVPPVRGGTPPSVRDTERGLRGGRRPAQTSFERACSYSEQLVTCGQQGSF